MERHGGDAVKEVRLFPAYVDCETLEVVRSPGRSSDFPILECSAGIGRQAFVANDDAPIGRGYGGVDLADIVRLKTRQPRSIVFKQRIDHRHQHDVSRFDGSVKKRSCANPFRGFTSRLNLIDPDGRADQQGGICQRNNCRSERQSQAPCETVVYIGHAIADAHLETTGGGGTQPPVVWR